MDYADYHVGQNLPHVWNTIGGWIGKEGNDRTWLPCAAELSYGLNQSGDPVQKFTHGSNRNTDGTRYIVSARQMRKYLWSHWGRPDYPNHGVFMVDPSSSDFLNGLRLGNGTAVFATDGHVGAMVLSLRMKPGTTCSNRCTGCAFT
jgi:hypothetical protein